MNLVDITEAIEQGISNVIYKQWRHAGYINYINTDKVSFVVDGKTYEATIREAAKEAGEC